MVSTICLPTSHLLIIFCIFLGLIAFYNDKSNTEKLINIIRAQEVPSMVPREVPREVPQETPNESKQKDSQSNVKIIYLEKEKPIKKYIYVKQKPVRKYFDENDDIERREFLKKRDAGVINNVLHPPERRVPEHNYPFNYVKNQINIPTRGLPDNFHQVGVVLRDNTETAYNLFGRQKFPGSSQYEYYVVGTMGFNTVKLPIKIRGDKEVEDGQSIDIPGTRPDAGQFKVQLYDYDAPRYYPNVL